MTVTLSVDYGVLDVLARHQRGSRRSSTAAPISSPSSAPRRRSRCCSAAISTSTVGFTAEGDDPPAGATLTVTVDDGTAQSVATARDRDRCSSDARRCSISTRVKQGTTRRRTSGSATGRSRWRRTPCSADVGSHGTAGATLTVTVIAGGAAGDLLQVNDIGTGGGQSLVAGSTISYQGTAM